MSADKGGAARRGWALRTFPTLREGVLLRGEQENAEFQRGQVTRAQRHGALDHIKATLADKQACADIANGRMEALKMWRRWQWAAHSATVID